MTERQGGRLLVGAGPLAALVISPPFALSYFPAYGGAEESPPGWLANLVPRLVDWGWLGTGDPEGLYATYGLWYAACLTVAVAGLVLLLRAELGSGWMRGGWGVVVVGLGLSTIGTFGDYAGVDVLQGLFLLELVGALVIAVGTMMIGVRLWRQGRRGLALVGLVGPTSLVFGFGLFGHFPSGPLAIDLAACLVMAFVGSAWSKASMDPLPG